jgi:hypothetical protein
VLTFLIALALQAPPPDAELDALVRCQFAVSRQENMKGSSTEQFERVFRSACLAEERLLARRMLEYLVSRGRAPDEAQREIDRVLAEGRGHVIESYGRALDLSQ